MSMPSRKTDMNVTERVIREQFPYWDGARAMELPPLGAGCHVIVGCGTSYHLAVCLAAAFNRNGHAALAVPGGEWARRRGTYLANSAGVRVIALSRSGESTETVQAVEVSRAAGLATTAITCEPESSIARAAAEVIHVPTHPDEGIVMTSSASLMLLVGLRMAGVAVGPDVGSRALALLDRLDAQLAGAIAGRSHFVYLGSGPFFGLAAEGALKLQEMSLSYSQWYHPMEYRHGPISLVDDKTFVVLVYNPDAAAEEAKVAAELRQKGAFVIGFGGPGDLAFEAAETTAARALEILPALQILGERVAEARGADSEAPRHLSKVVVLA